MTHTNPPPPYVIYIWTGLSLFPLESSGRATYIEGHSKSFSPWKELKVFKFRCCVGISSKVDCTEEPGVEWEPLIAGDGSTWRWISTVRFQATGIWQPTGISLPRVQLLFCPAGIVPCAEAPASSPSSPSPTPHSQDILTAACSHNIRFSSPIFAQSSLKFRYSHSFFYEVFEAREKCFSPNCSCVKARSAQVWCDRRISYFNCAGGRDLEEREWNSQQVCVYSWDFLCEVFACSLCMEICVLSWNKRWFMFGLLQGFRACRNLKF